MEIFLILLILTSETWIHNTRNNTYGSIRHVAYVDALVHFNTLVLVVTHEARSTDTLIILHCGLAFTVRQRSEMSAGILASWLVSVGLVFTASCKVIQGILKGDVLMTFLAMTP